MVCKIIGWFEGKNQYFTVISCRGDIFDGLLEVLRWKLFLGKRNFWNLKTFVINLVILDFLFLILLDQLLVIHFFLYWIQHKFFDSWIDQGTDITVKEGEKIPVIGIIKMKDMSAFFQQPEQNVLTEIFIIFLQAINRIVSGYKDSYSVDNFFLTQFAGMVFLYQLFKVFLVHFCSPYRYAPVMNNMQVVCQVNQGWEVGKGSFQADFYEAAKSQKKLWLFLWFYGLCTWPEWSKMIIYFHYMAT